MARRSPGDGNISYLKAKKLYRGRVEMGRDQAGKRIRKTLYDRDKKALIQKMQDFRRTSFGLKIDEPTLDELFQRWLYIKRPDLKPKSFQRYEGVYLNHVKQAPFIDEKVRSITPGDIKSWYTSLEDGGV